MSGPRPVPRFLALLLTLVAGTAETYADAPSDPLPRRGFLGTQVGPVPPEAREANGVGGNVGVLVIGLVEGGTAGELGLKPGDVITAVGDATVEGPPAFVGLVSGKKTGEPVSVTFVRGGETLKASARLKERPRETLAGAEVVYGSVASKGGRLRTILTRPEGPAAEKRPALFVIQGLGGFSVENSGPIPAPYAEFIGAFHKKGYVTFRVEKPGQGDSEGGPTRDADFEDELDGYRQGLRALKADPGVDPDRVILFGHSMGGVMGPLIAAENPVKGVAVYGTVVKTWNEYLLENTRRQAVLAGDSLPTVDQVLRQDAAIQHLLLAESKSPGEIAAEHPDLRGRLDQTVAEGKYLFGRHVDFFRQLAATNLPEGWSRFDGHALAAWGKADYVSTEADHAMIAGLVNRDRPGHGTFLAVEGSDHGFHAAETFEESFAASRGGEPGPFVPAFLNALVAWSDGLVGPPPR